MFEPGPKSLVAFSTRHKGHYNTVITISFETNLFMAFNARPKGHKMGLMDFYDIASIAMLRPCANSIRQIQRFVKEQKNPAGVFMDFNDAPAQVGVYSSYFVPSDTFSF